MKTLILFLIIIYHSSLFAGGFSFIPKNRLFENDIGTIHAKVKFGHDHSEHLCLVDTGARFTIFKESILNDLPKIGETIGGGVSDTSQTTDLVNLDFTLGNWEMQNATVGRTNRIPFECLIGNDFFIGRKFKINFNRYEISDLEDSLKTAESFPAHVYRTESGGHFGFEMNLAQTTVETIFDTGASATVVSLAFVKTHPRHFKFKKDIGVTDGNSKELKAGLYELDELSFGHTVLKKVPVYVLDLTNLQSKLPNVEMVLGLNIIQNFNWQLDLQNSRFSYETK